MCLYDTCNFKVIKKYETRRKKLWLYLEFNFLLIECGKNMCKMLIVGTGHVGAYYIILFYFLLY